jgi:hypothetical protein
LKDTSAPKELHRSVLKFIKVAITYIDFTEADKSTEILQLILSHVFSLENARVYAILIRRIVSKLMFRVGPGQVKKHTLKEHQPLMAHIEKERRKKKNAAERKRLLAELKINEKKNSSAIAQLTEKDNAVEIEDNESGDDESDEELSDMEEDQNAPARSGLDRLASSSKFDIPRASDIPVVSELARERAREMRDHKPAPEVRTKKTKDQIDRVIEDEDMELETHFVENPFIKIRQKAARKLEGPTEALGVEDFVNDAETDIILMKDENKLVVKDLEKMDRDAARAKVLKRKH